MRIVRSCCILFFLFQITLPAYSGAHETDLDNGYKLITAPEVKNMLERNNVMLIHVLSQLEYEMQHISGSINIPFNEVASTGKLPADKNISLIFYCMGKK